MSESEFAIIIQTGPPKVGGIDPAASELIRIELPLTPIPPDEWIENFNNRPPGVGYSVSPQLRGATIYLSAPDAEIEKYVAHAKELVEATNAHYNENAAPRLRAEHDDAAAKKTEEARRLEDARKRVEGL